MADYLVRPLTRQECSEIAHWRYDPEFSTYQFDGEEPDPADGFFAVEDGQGSLVGYCCYGAEARVPGVEAEPDVLDIGYGMHPDLVGSGRGRAYVEAIVEYGLDTYEPERLRALVLDWNARSLAVCRRVGFESVGEVATGQGRFVVLERPA